jgi:hypothetical protein
MLLQTQLSFTCQHGMHSPSGGKAAHAPAGKRRAQQLRTIIQLQLAEHTLASPPALETALGVSIIGSNAEPCSISALPQQHKQQQQGGRWTPQTCFAGSTSSSSSSSRWSTA